MTKAELIRKIAKNVGVPDTDAKIFFELFLKRISAVVDIGQSIFVNDFGYFHLIKGSIKKPVFSFKDNEVSEEAVDLVLYSEDRDLRKSDTKGLVFNIPFFDEEDYHPIDSSFSLSIGKPLIPLRGVPFDNIYIPTSGYEYRRLIESKVEKIITASQIAESEENFPTLVIDARSYNSNQVQLQWDEKNITIPGKKTEPDSGSETKTEISEYEKQTKELKNIEWDFGEDLSQQIEAESILDITDERINMELNPKVSSKNEIEIIQEEKTDTKQESESEISFIPENVNAEEPEFVEDIFVDDSSEKLNELLEGETKPIEFVEEDFVDETLIETVNEVDDEISIDDELDEVKPGINENVKIEDEKSDQEFWKSTSKYFEPFKPGTEQTIIDEFKEVKSTPLNLGDYDSKENEEVNTTDSEEVSMSVENPMADKNVNANAKNDINGFKDEIKNSTQENIELEKVEEQKAEYFEAEKKKNLIPFIIFPLLIIVVSVALYWYLEFYKKSETTVKPKQIVLKSDNVKIVARSFDFPVTYPYLPKVNEPTISETVTLKTEKPSAIADNIEEKKTEQIKPEEKKIEKVVPKKNITETKVTVKPIVPTGKSLNVGNNIYKYENYFVVQVAAFRSVSISENEAGKYRNKGYNAFVETAEIPDRGLWYRVKVGNFSTKDEAQDFINKNIR